MASEIRVNKIENRSGLGTVTFADTGVDLAGIVTATTFSGSGASLTNLPAANVTGTLPAISGANLTNLPAANLTGTLPAISGANLTGIAATDNVRTGILDVAGIATFRNDVNIGTAVTISESGIDAVGLGITVRSINGSQLSGRRNLVINGGMSVAQRATSAATQDGSGNEGYMTLDRWRILYSSSAGGAATMSQDTEVPTDYSWGRFSKSLKMDVTTADTSIDTNHAITLQHRMEAQDLRNSGWDYTNPNSILSVSFWAKSVKAGTYCVAVNSQDMSPNKDFIVEYTLVANTWKHIEMEIPGNSGLVIDDNNGSGMNFLWALVTGSGRQGTAGTWTNVSGETKYGTSNQVNFYDSTDNNFYLTGVQIEVGKPTVFEHRSFAEELALCQRYCQKFDGLKINARMNGSTNSDGYWQFPTMRATPSFSSDVSSGKSMEYGSVGRTVANVYGGGQSPECAYSRFNISGSGTSGHASYNSLSTGSYYLLDAEL